MRVRPRSTQLKPGLRRTPRRHPATRNDGLPQSSTHTRQHEIGRQANSPPAYRHCGTMGLPEARRGHDTVLGPAPADSPPAHWPSGAAGLPAPLTPHTHNFSHKLHNFSSSQLNKFARHNEQHCETPVCRKVRRMRVRPRSAQHKPVIRRTPRRHPATRNDGLPQSSTRTRQTRNRTPIELPADIPTLRNDGPPPKLDVDTTQCSPRRQRTPRQHTGLAEQRDSPRRSRRNTHFHICIQP